MIYKIGDVVQYKSPGMTLVSGDALHKGKVLRVSKSGKNVLLEDIEIDKRETKLYQRWICANQIEKIEQ